MSRIHSRDTSPELALRSALHREGFRFRLHRKDLPGKPDILLPKHQAVIFVHGCFWHNHARCVDGHTPKTNSDYWRDKLQRNVTRDRKHRRLLRQLGWTVLIIWECEIRKDATQCVRRIEKVLGV